jgi:tetratricopeptide (TPR) repeat protein
MRYKRFPWLATLLLISSLRLPAQETPGPATVDRSIDGFVTAYGEFYKMSTAEGKPPEPAEVARILKNLKSHFKEYPDAFLKAGEFYFRIGDPERAIRQYQEGMAADASRKIDYQKRTIEVLMRQRKTAQAYELDREILKDHPQDPEARGLEASFRLDKGEIDPALAELQSVVQEVPGNYVAQFNLGRAWFAKGDLVQARRQFEAALALKPDYQPARLAATQVALRTGDADAALKYSRETLQTDPNSGVSTLMEAAALLRKGEYDESRVLLGKILQGNPDQPDALLELGVLNLTQKRYDEAEVPFRRAYTVDPSNLRGLLGVAEVRFSQNQPDQAVQVIAAEVKKQPNRADLRKELANTEFRARQFDKAVADYESLVDKYKEAPEQAELFSRLGVTYSALGVPQKAIENMQKANQLAPSNAGYLSMLAQLYDTAGNRPAALAAYREAAKLDPNNGVVLNNLAYLLARTGGDLDEALAFALHARQLLPRMDDIVDTVGWIYLKQNLAASAIEIFRELNGRVKDNPAFHYHYGMALALKGDKAGALQELQTALQCKPNPQDEREIKELIQALQSPH